MLTLRLNSAFGDQGRDLTSEQQAALEALVKGIDGYQASSEGATNTDQTEQEIWQQAAQTIESTPLLSSLSPVQIEGLLTQLGSLLRQGQIGKKPSASSMGSQAGQTASQASWMIPVEGTLRDAGYSVNSNADNVKDSPTNAPNAQGLVLLNRLQLLQEQEQSLLQQIQASQGSASMPPTDERFVQGNYPIGQNTNGRLLARSTSNREHPTPAERVAELLKSSTRKESFEKRLLDLLRD